MTRHVDPYYIALEEPFRRFISDPTELVDLGLGVEVRGKKAVLSKNHPTIVYRYPSSRDNSRTMIATALPSTGYLFSKGYASGLETTTDSTYDILALLGVLNSIAADWWVRRFVDRHVTKQVIESVPLPSWGGADRTRVGKLVAMLLMGHGQRDLPGPRGLKPLLDDGGVEQLDRSAVRIAIEVAVLQGYGLSAGDFETMLRDFSEEGAPPDLREGVEQMLRRAEQRHA